MSGARPRPDGEREAWERFAAAALGALICARKDGGPFVDGSPAPEDAALLAGEYADHMLGEWDHRWDPSTVAEDKAREEENAAFAAARAAARKDGES